MSVSLVQTEKTYDVEYGYGTYTITIVENAINGYVHYDVYDDSGNIIEGNLEEELIAFLEENT